MLGVAGDVTLLEGLVTADATQVRHIQETCAIPGPKLITEAWRTQWFAVALWLVV